MPQHDNDDYRQLLRERILDETSFVRASFTGQARGDSTAMPWQRLIIRPVMLKNRRHLQFSYFDARQDITKNYAGDAAAEQLDSALALPFKNFHVHTTGGEVQVRISKKGKPLVSETLAKPSSRLTNAANEEVELAHDRQKRKLLTPETPETAAYLKAVGIMTQDGRIKADMQHKFKQINKFLELVADTGALAQFEGKSVEVVDAGCGNAYLTFAAYHYLTHILKIDTHLTGIDVRGDLMQRHTQRAEALGWSGMNFQPAQIIDYTPETAPQIVIALHACDTATDEAIAQGLRWNSDLIICAPCCHHHLQAQLAKNPTPAPFDPVMRHGILFERFGDILTDSFRALILRIMGYRTDVVQFVSSEHTPRDLMIRAVKTTAPGEARFVEEYRALKAFWGVTPYLETLLPESVFRDMLSE